MSGRSLSLQTLQDHLETIHENLERQVDHLEREIQVHSESSSDSENSLVARYLMTIGRLADLERRIERLSRDVGGSRVDILTAIDEFADGDIPNTSLDQRNNHDTRAISLINRPSDKVIHIIDALIEGPPSQIPLYAYTGPKATVSSIGVKTGAPPCIKEHAMVHSYATIKRHAKNSPEAVVKMRAIIGEAVIVENAAVVDSNSRVESGILLEPGALIGSTATVRQGGVLGTTAIIHEEARIAKNGTVEIVTTTRALGTSSDREMLQSATIEECMAKLREHG